MTEFNIISPGQFKEVLWKNGKGITKELFVKYQTGDDKYIFRISIAGVTEDGPFSDFTGYDRALIMLEGNGIVLNHSDGSINELRDSSEIALFSGDLKTYAVLTDRAIKDFNVMTLRGKCRAEIEIIHPGEKIKLDGNETFIYARSGTVELKIKDLILLLPEGYLLRISEKYYENTSLKSGEIIMVRIYYYFIANLTLLS